jgi:hypothetical protein
VRKPRSLITRWISRSRLFLAALALLVEEWLWRGTAKFLNDLVRLRPVAACAAWIRRRLPYQALGLFVLPLLALLPLKGAIVLAFVHGRMVLGTAVLVLQKLIFSAIFAALYQLTEPAITKIGWVLRAQNAFLHVRGLLHAWFEQQPAYRQARAWMRRIRRHHGLRRRFGAAYRMQRRRTSRFCFGR